MHLTAHLGSECPRGVPQKAPKSPKWPILGLTPHTGGGGYWVGRSTFDRATQLVDVVDVVDLTKWVGRSTMVDRLAQCRTETPCVKNICHFLLKIFEKNSSQIA